MRPTRAIQLSNQIFLFNQVYISVGVKTSQIAQFANKKYCTNWYPGKNFHKKTEKTKCMRTT